MTAFRALVVVETVAEMAAPRPNSTNLIMHAAPRKAARMRMEAGRATSGQACGRRRLRGGSWSPGGSESNFGQFGMVNGPGESARWSAHEALPQTPPGEKPPETPGPFPCHLIVRAETDPSRVRKPRKNRAPLTDPYRPGARFIDQGKGPVVSRLAMWAGPEEWVQTREGEILLDRTDLLMEGR